MVVDILKNGGGELLSFIIGVIAIRIYVFIKGSLISLKEHRLFKSLLKAIVEIDGWKVPENREALRVMLKAKLTVWYDEAQKLAEELEGNLWKLSKQKLRIQLQNWTLKTIHIYNTEWQKKKIPIDLIVKINKSHQSKVDDFSGFIDDALTGRFYFTNKLRVIAVYDILATLLAETKTEFLDYIFMKEFNGDLLNAEFNGIPLNDKKYKEYLKNKNNQNK